MAAGTTAGSVSVAVVAAVVSWVVRLGRGRRRGVRLLLLDDSRLVVVCWWGEG